MAVQIINPVETDFSTSPLAVEGDTESADEFTWISMLCCTYSTPVHTDINSNLEEDIDV